MSTSTLSRFELGQKSPRLDQVERLALALDLLPDQLQRFEEPKVAEG